MMERNDKKASGFTTQIIHNEYQAPAGFAAFTVPIHHASTVLFDNVAAMRARTWLENLRTPMGCMEHQQASFWKRD